MCMEKYTWQAEVQTQFDCHRGPRGPLHVSGNRDPGRGAPVRRDQASEGTQQPDIPGPLDTWGCELSP